MTGRIRWRAAVLGVAAVAAAALAACTGYQDGARPGLAYAGGGGTVDSPQHKVVVQLPLGPLTIETGKPQREVSSVHSPDRAADGATFVPVAWTLAGNGADYSHNEPAFQFRVTLVAGGKRYDLQAGHDADTTASKYTPVVKEKSIEAVVQGDGKHLRIEVEYDGLTQTADLDSGRIRAGLAAPLYRKDAPHTALATAPCSLLSAADSRRYQAVSSTTCRLGPVQLTPYVGGLGWVRSAAESWVLVPLSVHLNGFEGIGTDARYENVAIKDIGVTVDGRRPTTEILRYRDPDPFASARDGVLVFRTAATPHALRLRTTLRARNLTGAHDVHTFAQDRTYPLR